MLWVLKRAHRTLEPSQLDIFENPKHTLKLLDLTLYLIEAPLNAFANRADPDQAVQGLLCLHMEI